MGINWVGRSITKPGESLKGEGNVRSGVYVYGRVVAGLVALRNWVGLKRILLHVEVLVLMGCGC